MATIDDSTFSAVNNANYKTVAEMGILNALAHQNRCNIIAESSLGCMVERMNTLDVAEAAGVSQVATSDLPEILGQLSGAIANAQQLMKGAQTTAPVTA